MLHVISTIVLVMIGVGLKFRRRRNLHWKIMTAACVTDFSLVLYIELTRHAVEKVVSQVRPFIWFHAAISTSVLVLYVVMIVLGRRVLTAAADVNTDQIRRRHRNFGVTFCVLRLMNYVTALML